MLQEHAGTHFEVCLEGGGVSAVVGAAARHHHADLVVIGRGRDASDVAIATTFGCPLLESMTVQAEETAA